MFQSAHWKLLINCYYSSAALHGMHMRFRFFFSSKYKSDSWRHMQLGFQHIIFILNWIVSHWIDFIFSISLFIMSTSSSKCFIGLVNLFNLSKNSVYFFFNFMIIFSIFQLFFLEIIMKREQNWSDSFIHLNK